MIEIENMPTGYAEVIQHVKTNGQRVAPRDQPTLEVLDAIIRIEDPTRCLPVGVGRKLNPAIAAVEAAQLIGGVSDPVLTTRIAPNMLRYLDGGSFWGAYGPRVRSQLVRIQRRLQDDPDTRQAVLSIWNANDLMVDGVADLPCTVFLQFLIRQDRLILHTSMRSNDVWWGLAYDAFQFSQLQLTMANALNVYPGPYFHHAVSLHLYERDQAAAEQVVSRSPTSSGLVGFDCHGDGIAAGMNRAQLVLNGFMPAAMTPTEGWYLNTLDARR